MDWTDTAPQMAELQKLMLRQAGMAERFALVRSLTTSTIQLSRRAIARNHPNLQDAALNSLFIAHHYGSDLAHAYDQFVQSRTHEDT